MISFRNTLTKRLSTVYDEPAIQRSGFLGLQGEVSADKRTFAEKTLDIGLSFKKMHLMYLANPWIRACVDKIVDRVGTVKPIVRPTTQNEDAGSADIPDETKRNMDRLAEFLQSPNGQPQTFTDIRKMVCRDVLKYDGAGLEIVRGLSAGERFAELYAVPGDAIVINTDNKGNLDKQKAYVQVDIATAKEVAAWKPEQFIYYMMNPQSNRIYGLSPLESLVQTVTAELYSSQYNLDFFFNNATPRFAVLMEGLGPGQGAPALQRFRKWWDDELKGNPHRPIVIGTESGKIQFQKVGLSNEEMQFQQYSMWLLIKIMSVYKVPPAVLGLQVGDTMSKVSSDEQFKQFKIDTLQPHLQMFYEKLNMVLVFSQKALNIRDTYIDYDLDIVDKKEQAEWHQIYLQTGVITINQIRHSIGMRPVPWGDVPYMQNNVAPFGAGPNGAAAPETGSPNQVPQTGSGTEQSGGGNVVARNIISIHSDEDIKKAVMSESGFPVGWEGIPPEERITIIEKMIKERQSIMSKRHFIPASL